jgi:hypothetical protein
MPWYAVAGPPTGRRQAKALTELAHLAAGRTDLLARYAGQSLAWHDSHPDDPVPEITAQLCIAAGADMNLIDRWHQEGLSRRAISTRPNRQTAYHDK